MTEYWLGRLTRLKGRYPYGWAYWCQTHQWSEDIMSWSLEDQQARCQQWEAWKREVVAPWSTDEWKAALLETCPFSEDVQALLGINLSRMAVSFVQHTPWKELTYRFHKQ